MTLVLGVANFLESLVERVLEVRIMNFVSFLLEVLLVVSGFFCGFCNPIFLPSRIK